MNAKDINAKWQAEINMWIANDKIDKSASEEHKIIRDKIFNGKAKWWYDPYDGSWNVMTNDEIPLEVGQKYIYIGETNKMKKVKQYSGIDGLQGTEGHTGISVKSKNMRNRIGKIALVSLAALGLISGVTGIMAAGEANKRADNIDTKIIQIQKQQDKTNTSIQLLVDSTTKMGETSTEDAIWMKNQVDNINAKLAELGK